MAVGLTLTPAPLVAAKLPGVITPVPFAKTPVRVALDPAVMVVGLAVKLVIVGCAGGGGVWVLDDPLPQPLKPARPRIRVMASEAKTSRRFMGFPASRSTEILTRAQRLQRAIGPLVDDRRTCPSNYYPGVELMWGTSVSGAIMLTDVPLSGAA